MGIIEFKDVSFQYPNGFSAVENVSFEINEGEAINIIGQNGAGKKKKKKMINGLLKPTHGTVLIDGMDTKDYTTAQLSKIAGYVFQNPDDQIFHNNVEDEIRFGPKKQGLSEEEIENWLGMVKEAFPNAKVFYGPLSASIACHTGPGAVGIGISF